MNEYAKRTPAPKRRARLDLRKTIFVLPNLFTLSSIFCGFYSIVICGSECGPVQIKTGAMLIAFALFFDMIDGRVARLTKTQTDFGIQLDSLADVISFGIAPGLLGYRYGLDTLGTPGIFVGFAFAACGAIRLARFNVLAQRDEGSASSFFVGLPIPLAAGMVISVMLANHGDPVQGRSAMALAGLMVLMSGLMVSTVRYRTFKKMKSRLRTMLFFGSVVGVFAFAAQVFRPGMALALMFAFYVTFGLVEETVRLLARRPHSSPVVDVDTEEELPALFGEDEEEDEDQDERLA